MSFSESEWVLRTGNVSFNDGECNFGTTTALIWRILKLPDDHKCALFSSLSQLFLLASVQLPVIFCLCVMGAASRLVKEKLNSAWAGMVPIMFRSKETPRNGIFGFSRIRNGTRAKKWERGRGKRRKKTLLDKPRILKTSLARERVPDWLD